MSYGAHLWWSFMYIYMNLYLIYIYILNIFFIEKIKEIKLSRRCNWKGNQSGERRPCYIYIKYNKTKEGGREAMELQLEHGGPNRIL